MKYLISLAFLLIGCGSKQVVRKATHADQELKKLNQTILQLQGTIAQIEAFAANDFTDCRTGLPPFETKICEIAQTATAEQRLAFASQLADMAKLFQNDIYGEDCVNDTEAGCPKPGSILDKLATLDSAASDIGTLQLEVAALQLDLVNVGNRLDNFNGSSNSIESVIVALENEVVLLEARITALEDSVAPDTVYKTVALCDDNPDSGPVYEAVLLSGDRQAITGFVQNNFFQRGLAVIKSFGDGNGDLVDTTLLNTRTCRFKVYEDVDDLRICWHNTDRTADEVDIDLACDLANGFVSPTNDCTCR